MSSDKDDLSTIGTSHRRVDGLEKTTGKTRFLPDITVDRMVHAFPIYSSVPFGRITSLNDTDARAIPGFFGLVTAADVPGENQVGVILPDQPLFAAETVRFVGDVVGLAVAETRETAREAASKIQLVIEEHTPLLSIEASRQAKDGFLHASNLACSHHVDKGDVDAGFDLAHVVVEATFSTPFQEHYYLEPQGCIAMPGDDGTMEILGSLQCPFYVQKAVAKALGLSFSRVRVRQSPVGGAFGGKEDVPSEVCARAAVAAWKLQRPVKLVYRRRDDIQLTSKRHPYEMRYRVGAMRDGTLVAADVELHANAGAYATLSPVVSYRAAMQAMGPYVVPHVRVRSSSWYTNLPPTGAFRGFGSPQATFGHERIMDLLAAKLEMDPLELRRRNLLHPGDETLTGHRLEASVGVEETVARAAGAADWRRKRDSAASSGRYRKGIGIATSHYGNCLGAAGWALDGAGAKLQIHRDGSISVAYGLVDMGQGALTVVAQMAAEALGVSTDRIHVQDADTAQVPDSGPSVASRNVVMTGNALRNAADQLRPVLKQAAAELLECGEADVLLRDDRATDTRSGASLGFDELAEHLFTSNRIMDAVGWWHVPELSYDPALGTGQAYFTYSYATHVAEVEVDTLTGLVHVERIWAAHDVGRAINPAGVEAQVEGGTAQGIGYALMEHLQHAGGRITTANLSTYLLPGALDVAEVETIIVEDPEPRGPWGAKGIGEPAIIPTAAAIANAVSHALGVPVNRLPITPEQVLDALGEGAG